MADVKLLDRHCVAIDSELEWSVRIIYEVIAIDGCLFATLCPFVAHVVDCRTRYQHLEVVGCGVVRVVDHKDLVEHLTRNLTWYSHNHRVVGNQTRN